MTKAFPRYQAEGGNMKFSRVSIPASDAVTALRFLTEKCHEFSMYALTWQEVPGWGQCQKYRQRSQELTNWTNL